MIEAGSSTKTSETTCQNSQCLTLKAKKKTPSPVMQTVTRKAQNLLVDPKKLFVLEF